MIYAIGETVMDILFKNDKPIDAVPGGSAFNSAVSVGRVGVPCAFIGYTGCDRVGDITMQFMHDNGVGTRWFEQRKGVRSCISLAFLDDAGDAHYVFYKDAPGASAADVAGVPDFRRGDALLMGSYYAVSKGTRAQVQAVTQAAKTAGATIYYDLNFRSSHKDELDSLLPAIHENFEVSTVVRGSADDFDVMWGLRDARRIYAEHIAQYAPLFICTAGAGQITVCTPCGAWDYDVPQIEDVVSTVGAGDNFNAGFLCALTGVYADGTLPERWSKEMMTPLIDAGVRFAAQVCRTTENYVSKEFGQKEKEMLWTRSR